LVVKYQTPKIIRIKIIIVQIIFLIGKIK